MNIASVDTSPVSNGFTLCFDIGGTRIKAGLLDADCRLLEDVVADTPSGIDGVLREVRSLSQRLAEAGSPSHAGVCVPGLVNDLGVVVDLPGKLEGIVGFDLRGAFKKITGCDPVVVNDAAAYAVGEAAYGAGRMANRVVVVTIGTGVGVSVVEDRKSLGGGILGGGILGGMIPISDDDSYRDSGGHTGSIEALCSAARIVDFSNVGETAFSSVGDVYSAFSERDPRAEAGIARYRIYLARGLAALAHAHAPDLMILGGGPMQPDNPITPGLEEEVNRLLWGNYSVSVRLAELGDKAALVGLGCLGAGR